MPNEEGYHDRKMSPKAKNPVRTTEKTIQIINTLEEYGGAGVTEIADRLEMNKGTVHHHLSTLEEHGYVVKSGTKYKLGLRLFELGEFTRRQTEIYKVARPEIDNLAEESGELANLMVEEHGHGIYLYIARGDQAIQLDTKIGTRQYLHTSALGKAILAHLPENGRERAIDQHGLPAETPNTVTERQILLSELDEIKERGIAFDGEERAEGIRCVAAPVINNKEKLIGAVSVTGPSSRLKGERFQSKIPELVENTATVIGINASYS